MMGWLGFASRRDDRTPSRMEILLFPLNTVLFPGGVLPLRVFEQRYLDMAAACMKGERPFGICLIAVGEEVGGVAEPHPVGTLARIVDWEMEQLGLLQVTTRGEQRFRIVDKEAGPDKLWRARVEVIANDGPLPFPVERERLLPLLARHAAVDPEKLAVFGREEWFAPVASGSNPPDAMVVCPCSMGTLAAIAQGLADNLIERAADVVLKEGRKLILVPRETPLSAIHLENMLRLARAGAVILPPSPGFYHHPQTVADLVDFVVARVLDQLAIPHALLQRWGE